MFPITRIRAAFSKPLLPVVFFLAGVTYDGVTLTRIDNPVDNVILLAYLALLGALIVITARAENFLHDRKDLGDTIARLQRYQEAGADVLFAPGVTAAEDLRSLVGAVDRPVNVLALPGVPSVAELAEIGVARVSVGAAFLWTAFSAVVDAGRQMLDEGSFGYFDRMGVGLRTARPAFKR